jgi:hypothetical protein
MKLSLRLVCLPVIFCSLPSCGLLTAPAKILGSTLNSLKLANAKKKDEALQVAAQDAPKETKTPLNSNAVGEVSYVDAESGFILIRQASGQRIVPSTALLSKSSSGSITAKLMSSTATKGSFVAADILSGTPERGNPIHLDPDAKTKAQDAAKPMLTPVDPSAEGSTGPRQAPKLEPILPPLTDLRPPSGEVDAPALPVLPQ